MRCIVISSSSLGEVVVHVTNNGVGNLTERSGGLKCPLLLLTEKGCGLQVSDVGSVT